ncbi:MAG: hypothetical protein J1E16_06525 [Muribaculaceae bacterium]|nr:hypothetical protein [Muribaculaceae bacterium]
MAENKQFVIFSSKAAFNAGSDKYDNNSIVFVKDANEPGIYTHAYGWNALPNNAVANQILSFVEGKAKWIDKDYYTKSEVESKLDEIDVTDQLVDYAKSEDVTKEIADAVKDLASKSEIPTDFYSKEEVDGKVANVKSEILGGVGQDYDTLKEIETWIGTHQELYQALVNGIATKASIEYVDGKVEDMATMSWVEEQNYLKTHQSLDAYATKEYVGQEIAKIEVPSVEGLASEEYVDNAVEDMATMTWVKGQNYLTTHQSLEGYAKTSEVEALISDFVTEDDVDEKLEGYYTQAEVDAMFEWGEY